MTQFNTTLTAAAPRSATQPLVARLKKSAEMLRQRCAAWLTPFGVEDEDIIEDYEARSW